MKNFGVILIGAALLFYLSGCQPTKGDQIDRNKEMDVSFKVLHGSNLPEDISKWLENNKEFEQAMLVEDRSNFYAVVTRGCKNTGGYDVRIKKMTLHLVDGTSRLQVGVKYTDPAPGTIVTQSLTYPYVVAKVDLQEKPGEVKFDIENE